MSTKMAEGLMTFPINLTLTCYYLLLSHDVNSPRLLCKQKMAEG